MTMIQDELLSAPEKCEGSIQDNADGCNCFFLRVPGKMTLVGTLNVEWSFSLLQKGYSFCSSKNNKSTIIIPSMISNIN